MSKKAIQIVTLPIHVTLDSVSFSNSSVLQNDCKFVEPPSGFVLESHSLAYVMGS